MEFTHIDIGGVNETSTSDSISGKLKKLSDEHTTFATNASIQTGLLNSISSVVTLNNGLCNTISALATSINNKCTTISSVVIASETKIDTISAIASSISSVITNLDLKVNTLTAYCVSISSMVTNIDAEVDLVGDHLHSTSFCYPTLAPDKTFTSNALAWNLGAYELFIPTNTVAAPFDCHFLNISAMNTIGTYELQLFDNEQTTTAFLCSVRFNKSTVQDTRDALPILMPIVAANHAIYARLACSKTNALIEASLFYHTY